MPGAKRISRDWQLSCRLEPCRPLEGNSMRSSEGNSMRRSSKGNSMRRSSEGNSMQRSSGGNSMRRSSEGNSMRRSSRGNSMRRSCEGNSMRRSSEGKASTPKFESACDKDASICHLLALAFSSNLVAAGADLKSHRLPQRPLVEFTRPLIDSLAPFPALLKLCPLRDLFSCPQCLFRSLRSRPRPRAHLLE
jgi:hypothetical protein